ncbi:MAG TPA: TRAP transporter large permease subunit [Geminicoccaceae bacterium]|nr:TRAP transporter large permease subunit [Geminicoccus sp.]HMU50949.1 TRAP transporter large permease subunit [Geminicoccaceae bacterium]
MSGEILSLLLFAVSWGVLLLGFPVAFGLAGSALAFALVGSWLDVFDLRLLGSLPLRFYATLTNEVLVAIPLFIFMGVLLERSRLGEELLETMGALFGRVRGGLGYAVIIVGMLLAATTGIIGATVVTMGLISLPGMMRAGYDPRLACGTICAAGTLGQIIPPSIVLVILGDTLQGVNAQAQLAMGNFAPDPISVVDLFAGAILPGLVLVAIYIGYQAAVAILQPGRCPAIVRTRPVAAEQLLWSLLVPVALIVAVLGSILFGLATPTESASVGAVGTILICALRRRLGGDTLVETMRATLRMTSMIYVILFGASVFSLVFVGLGGEKLVHDTLHALPGGPTAAMAVVMLLVFLLGFALDFIEIVVIVVPIVGPALLVMGIDPLWLGIMLAVNLQTSFLTPPLGPALFYLRGVAPPEVSSKAMYAGAWPFVWLQLLGLGVLWLFPGLATWLPSVLLN